VREQHDDEEETEKLNFGFLGNITVFIAASLAG
jgi:hypothetical protein